MALICETVTASNMRDLRRLRDASTADMVELRLDFVQDIDVAGALEGRRRPVLITCRASREGGRFSGAEETRLAILREALLRGSEYVDIEWTADRRAIPSGIESRLVISHHHFEHVPGDIKERVQAMRAAAPAGVVKVACATSSPSDLSHLHAVSTADSGRHVIIGMGTAGLVSRVCPDRFGSAWTFGGSAAPGQLPIAVLDSVYRIRSQTATTRLFALTGTPLAHSASPAMHNAAFAHLGMDAVYVAIEVNDASDAPAFLALADTLHVEGVSVTAPLKRAWEAAGVALDRRASDIGAANTLMTSGDGSWRATNFDVEGFMAPLRRRRLDLDDARCVVLGAGGAARAAAWALKREKARVEISARRADRAAAMANESGVAVGEWPPQPGWDLLVNATPVGTWPGESDSPIPRASVVGRTVYDLVYHPRRTQLLRWAEEAGIAGIEGLDMLVAQAALQFELWTGRQAPVDVMREAAEAFLEEPGSDETDHL